MSKFNFLAGGYYGKLGQTVGQRWKNKRVLRTYVIPNDPKTERQLANRAVFGEATKAVQLALQLNAGLTRWQSPDNTEFNIRMSSARRYYTAGMNIVEYVPAIPYGTIADFAFDQSFTQDGNTFTFTCSAAENLLGRSMAVLAQVKNNSSQQVENTVINSSVTGTAGNWKLSFTIPVGFSVATDGYALAVSNDDDSHNGTIIYLPPTLIASSKPVIEVTMSPVTASNPYGSYWYLIPTFDVQDVPAFPSDLVFSMRIRSLVNLKWTETTYAGSIVTEGGVNRLAYNIPSYSTAHQLFPTGSTIKAEDFEIETGTALYKFTMPTAVAIQETASVDDLFTGVSPTQDGKRTVYDAGECDLAFTSNVTTVSVASISNDADTEQLNLSAQMITENGHLKFVLNTTSEDIVYSGAQSVTLYENVSAASLGISVIIRTGTTWSVQPTASVRNATALAGIIDSTLTSFPTVRLKSSCTQAYFQDWEADAGVTFDFVEVALYRSGSRIATLEGVYADWKNGYIYFDGDGWFDPGTGDEVTPTTGDVVRIQNAYLTAVVPAGWGYIQLADIESGTEIRLNPVGGGSDWYNTTAIEIEV